MAHKGASLSRVASQMWLTSEGIFGVALGVSTNVVFFFVLFGSLLEKAGAGNYFIQLAFAMLGTFRGGPAKAGVVASGMTGMISGSSIANTVMTGTFTIPLMKRVGYSAVKAGAIEAAAGVNGQLMPPVMGAAAFLIAEYVGITYAEVVKHAFVPAFLTYGALFYIVDIEAAKLGLRGLPRSSTAPIHHSLLRALMTICGMIILSGAVYWGIGWTKTVFGAAATWILGVGAARGLCRTGPLQGEASRSCRSTIRHQGDRQGAGFLRHRADRPALPAAGHRADLVPDGGGNVARPVGLLGHAVPDFHHGHPAPAGRGFSRRARSDRANARGLRRSHHRPAERLAQHDLGRHRHRRRRHYRRHGFADRHRPGDDRNRRDRVRRQSDGHAGADGADLPDPRHRHADHRELCRGRDADGAGPGRGRRSRTTSRCRWSRCTCSCSISD